MKRFFHFKKILTVFSLIFLPFVLSACVPNIGGGGGKGPAKGEFVKGSVVKGFPTNIPLYKNAQVVESYGSKESYGASFVSDDGLAGVVEFYNKALPQLGWQVEVVQSSQTNYSFNIKNEGYEGSVIVNTAADGKKTAISAFVLAR